MKGSLETQGSSCPPSYQANVRLDMLLEPLVGGDTKIKRLYDDC